MKFVLLIVLGAGLIAQNTGSISGKIFDADTENSLGGATIRIVSINRSTGADDSGNYILQNLPIGNYELKISHIGYATQIIDDVEVEAGKEINVDIRLVSAPIIGNAVEVFTPTRRSQLLEDTPEITLVIRDIDIEQLSPGDISDAIAYLPGVSIEGGTGSGQPYDKIVSINGLPAQYSLVMMNGARVVSSHWHTGANINIIPPEVIEQIEVVKGAASAQYGSEGLGGVLNIITKRGDKNPSTLFTAYGGSRNTQYYSLLQNGNVNDDVSYCSFASWEKTDGDSIIEPTHRLGEFGYDKFTLLQSMDADISANLSTKAQMFYLSSHTSFRETEYESWLITPKIDLEYSPTQNIDFTLSGYYTQWNGEINTEKNEIAEPQIIIGYKGLKDNYLLVGGEYIYRNFTRKAVEEQDQIATGVFIQDEWSPMAKLSLLGALRYDKVENIDGVITPKLTLKYRPIEIMDFRLSVGRGFRAPTVQDLYEESYGHGDYRREGNPNLEPEYSTGVTGGMEFQPYSSLTILIDGYYTAMTDMITPVFDHTEIIIDSSETVDTTELDIYIRQNIHEATIYGGEIKICYNFFRNFILDGAFNYTHNENKMTGTSLPYYPGMTASAKLSGHEAITPWLGAGGFVGINFISNRKVWNWNNVSEEIELEDYMKLDAGLNIKFLDRYELFGTVNNILGQEIHMFEDVELLIDGIPQFTGGIRL